MRLFKNINLIAILLTVVACSEPTTERFITTAEIDKILIDVENYTAQINDSEKIHGKLTQIFADEELFIQWNEALKLCENKQRQDCIKLRKTLSELEVTINENSQSFFNQLQKR